MKKVREFTHLRSRLFIRGMQKTIMLIDKSDEMEYKRFLFNKLPTDGN